MIRRIITWAALLFLSPTLINALDFQDGVARTDVTSSLATIMSYSKPALEWVSISTVAAENNTSTLNETKIIFSDGTSRSVTEAETSVNAYRYFDITQTATFTNCGADTERAGLLTGLTEGASNWYSIYAVKSQCTSGTANFTLVGTTWALTQANRAILDSTFGTDSYVYLGLIRNGNNFFGDGVGDIVKFSQSENYTLFTSTFTYDPVTGGSSFGVVLSSAAADPSWTYTSGFGTTDIPETIDVITYSWASIDANTWYLESPLQAYLKFGDDYSGNQVHGGPKGPFYAPWGMLVSTTGETRSQMILLGGFYDKARRPFGAP